MASLVTTARNAIAEAPGWLAHVAAAATVIVTGVTASFGVLGAAIGAERFFRNSAILFDLALACCAIALFLVGLAYLQGSDETRRVRKNFYSLLALFVLSLAVVLGAGAIARAGSVDHGPSIEVDITAAGELSGSVSAAGLSGAQRLQVRILGLNGPVSKELEVASVGPDADGNASMEVATSLDMHRYDRVRLEGWIPSEWPWVGNPDCIEKPLFLHEQTYACVELPVIAESGPIATLKYQGSGETRSITGAVVAVPRRDEFLHVYVIDVESGEVLFRTVAAGQRGRPINVTIDTTVGHEHSMVCAMGELQSTQVGEVGECPSTDPSKGWVLLTSVVAVGPTPTPSPPVSTLPTTSAGSAPPSLTE